MNPKVSVLIPAYNQEKLVIKALESVPKRDDIEIIICDDGSTDKTAKSISSCYKTATETGCYKNFVFIKNTRNRGVAYTMNELYDLAEGEYVVALGSDDYFTDGFEEAMKELDGTDMVYFNLETNDGTIFNLTPDTKMYYCGSTKFIRREFIGDTRCPEDKKSGEDWYFYNELLDKNPTERFTGVVAKHYNFPREGSLSWKAVRGEI